MITRTMPALLAILFCALCLLPGSCNRDQNAPEPLQQSAAGEQAPPAPAAPEQAEDEGQAFGLDLFSSSAARSGPLDSLKKFVRNAELRFRVKNAAAATLGIEDIAVRNGGFVVKSDLNSQTEKSRTTPLSRDSAVETLVFSLHSRITFRVPYRQLDTALRAVGRLCERFDYRRVSADDVGLRLMEQELERIRQQAYRKELEDAPGRAVSEGADKVERTLRSRAATDEAHIETLKLEDAIRFSTVQIDIYEPPQIKRTIVANTEIRDVKAPFFSRAGEALRNGGMLLEALLIGLIHLWGVALAAFAGYVVWKKWPLFRK